MGVLNSGCDACECDSNTLTGFVHDADLRPLTGVAIAYRDRPYIPLAEITDTSGTFTVSGVCATLTFIVASKDLYGTVEKETQTINATSSTIDITMERMGKLCLSSILFFVEYL